MVTQEERQRWQRDARKSWRRAHQPKQGITLTSHANVIAARIMQHFPLHRIVVLFFIAIFIGSVLHAPSAQSKAAFISSSDFQTDNFVRLDMATGAGVEVTAQIDNTGFCDLAPRNWVDSRFIGVPVSSPSNCPFGASPVEQIMAAHFMRYQSITSGVPALAGTNAPREWLRANATLNTTADGNFTDAWNLTFSREYPVTNFRATIATSGSLNDPGGTITTWFQARNSAGGVVRQWVGPSQSCDVPATPNVLNVGVAFTEVLVRTITVSVNTSQCTFGLSQFLMSWWDFGVWNLGNKTASLQFALPGIDYADYLVKAGGVRRITANGGAGDGNYSNCANCSFAVGGSKAYYFYGARGCNITTCVSGGADTGCAFPSTFQFGSGVSYLGTAIAGDNGVCIFRMVADASEFVSGRINGTFGGNGQVTFWYDDDAKFWFLGSAGGNCGGALGTMSLNLTPGCEAGLLVRGFNLYANMKTIAGLKLNTFDGIALVVPDRGPALTTVSQDTALAALTLSAVNSDERLVDTITASKFAKGRQSFTVTLNPSTYFGNAIYFTIAAFNNTVTPEICTSTQNVTVNGQAVRLAWTRTGREPTLSGVPFARVCAWLVDDFIRTSGIVDTDANGNWLFLDNGRSAALRTYSVEVLDWPDENASGGVGHPLRFVQGFWARHSPYLACNKDLIACFGNLDTAGVSLSGVKTTWNWQMRDATNQTNNTDLNSVRVFDIVTGANGVSNISRTPHLQLNVTSVGNPEVRWVITLNSYLTAYLNLTSPPSNVVNVTVHMTRNVSTPFQTTLCYYDGAQANVQCVISFFDIPTNESCDLISGASFKCEVGKLLRVKRFIFFCPVDVAVGGVRGEGSLLNASYAETTGSGFAVTLTTCGGAANYGDATTLAIQTSTATFELTRIGYRSLKFTQTNFTPDLIFIVPWMQKGNGDATEIVKIFYFGNVSDPYSNNALRSYMYLYVIDNGAAGLTQEELRGLNFNIATGLPNLCDAMGLRGEAGHAICGIGALVTIIFAVGGMYYVAFQNTPPGNVMGLVGMLSFLGLSWVGLFPFWLVLIMVLFIIALVLLPFIRGGD